MASEPVRGVDELTGSLDQEVAVARALIRVDRPTKTTVLSRPAVRLGASPR
jgi:hypothetical protein